MLMNETRKPSMQEYQKQLAARYSALRNERANPVFFIEHGLVESEIAQLVADVRVAAEVHPLDSGWWDLYKLPLIVAATEVGYRYRGTGTDFWPVLEQELHSHIGGPVRQRIGDLFAAAATSFRGARPPATSWSKAFHLIAWPITHALVPAEFHRPLALTLANLQVKTAELDDESLHQAIRVAATHSSARFSTLLEDAWPVVAVSRRLLGTEPGKLCPEAMHRIEADLAADDVARRSVAAARRIQRTTSVSRHPRTKKAEPVRAINGALQIRRRKKALALEASFPPIDEPLGSRLRSQLRRRRFAPRLWGVAAPVPSEQLLSGLPFALKLETAPSDDSPLLPELDQLEIDNDLRDTMEAFALQVSPPVLFAVGVDNEVARQVRGPDISGHRKYWVLTGVSSSLARWPKLDNIGPYSCYELTPKEEDARQALTDLGFTVRFGISVAFAGPPSLDRDDANPSFLVGDQLIIVPRRSCPEGMLAEVDGNTTRAIDDEIVRVVVREGEQLLRVSSGAETREFRFQGVSASPLASSTVCSIAAQSSELTVQALLDGSLSFSIESIAPLEGLKLTVEIDAAGRKLSALANLDPLPQTLTSASEPFATLLEDDAARELLLQAASPTINLRVGSLCSRSWALEHRVRPFWWRFAPDGRAVLMNEIGELQFGEVDEAAPHLPPGPNTGEGPSLPCAKLLAPVGLDDLEYGTAALFTTLCIAPSKIPLQVPAICRPRLLRRRRADHSATGLEDLVEAYLRWSLAETHTLIAEVRRRSVAEQIDAWIGELCCGQVWADREAHLAGDRPWKLLTNICNETGLGRDSYVKLSREDEMEITRLAVEEIRRVLPELWTRVGPPCSLVPEDYESLDLAFGRAYMVLAEYYQKSGKEAKASEILEGDPGNAADEWDPVLARVKARTELRPLAELLLPTDTAERLVALDASLLSLDELVEEFFSWAHHARKAFAGSIPEKKVLNAILALWVEPAIAIGFDWRSALDTIIAERSVARAARYLALRSRQARRGGVA